MPRLAILLCITGVLAAVLTGCGAPSPTASSGAGIAHVVEIVDGDTVVLELSGSRETTRLLGIDTPETHHPSRPVECFGVEATARLAELVPVGSEVRVERDTEGRDHFGRLLLYVHRPTDDLFVNHAMVHDGFAVALHISPNDIHRAALAGAEADARAQSRGLWGVCGGPGVAIDPLTTR